MKTKIIHYCWFGNKKKPEVFSRCLDSWKKYCPAFELIEWNENNFNLNINDYVKDAYLSEKYAFVSDFCRYYVLYNYGGIYIDTDVEILKGIDDLPDNFIGFENEKHLASGLILGIEKGNKIAKEMLDVFDEERFYKNSKINYKTICEKETDLFKRYGLVCNNTRQKVAGFDIYPSEYFCPYNDTVGKMNITDNTYSIHWYASSWAPLSEKIKFYILKLVYLIFGEQKGKEINNKLSSFNDKLKKD